MGIVSNLNQLGKKVEKLSQDNNLSKIEQTKTKTLPSRKKIEDGIIACINGEEKNMLQYMCVKITPRITNDGLQIAKFAERGDGENTKYGSVITNAYYRAGGESDIVYVKTSGRLAFLYDYGDIPATGSKKLAIIGSKVYPLHSENGDFFGFVGVKSNNESNIVENNVVGKSLTEEYFYDDTDVQDTTNYTKLIFVDNNDSPEIRIYKADYACTPNDDIIDAADPANPDENREDIPYGYYSDSAGANRISVDGHQVVAGDLILASNQPYQEQKLWRVKQSAEWEEVGVPLLVFVQYGINYKFSMFGRYNNPTYTDRNYYRGIRAFSA